MNNTKVLLIALASIIATACVSDDVNHNQDGADVAKMKFVNSAERANNGELILFVDDATAAQLEASTDATRSGATALDAAIAEIGATEVRPVFNMLVNAELKRELDMHRWYVVTFPEDVNLEVAAKTLAEVKEVERVQFSVPVKTPKFNPVGVDPSAIASTRSESLPFDDPMLGSQWHYHNDGTVRFPNAKAGADINLFSAWEHTAGRPEVVVAVVDEGVCYTHEDLKASFLVNEAELNGTEGVDDDGNGYKDDIYGYNFKDKSRVTWTRSKDSGHGTHVAGTIAAVNNNGVGCCGVAGGSGKGDGVRIISCQIMSNGEAAGAADTAAAIEYAGDRGACVLQNSWGFGSGDISNDSHFETGANTAAELVAINYFKKLKNNPALDGGIVIFAAGNDGASVAVYPGAYNNLIAVTAIAPDGLPTYYTCYDRGCNVAAPGGEYTATWDTPGCVLSTLPTNIEASGYGLSQGTSMACPHVSGIAALAISYAMDNGITLTLPELKDIVVSSVNSLSQFMDDDMKSKPMPGGGTLNLAKYKNKMGTGLIDAFQALMAVRDTKCIPLPVGETVYLDISKYIGDGESTIKMLEPEISQEAIDALGIEDLAFISSKLKLTCTKPGTALVTLKYIAGGTAVGSGMITGGMAAEQEFAFVARTGISIDEGTNSPITPGGWL
ncbi:MAG: S8 family serine peptidase [Alistipes sp.]|nr:S8 family serine peptidase [Alistipes sp.]